ncbi:major facilitator superfamily domain-containing protein [Cantharellus anzutake]|uniref:major facilitator superfamily domain-containing protein n=1 Tax=Cantharellus anzutake TaxID=1750568 RepID=UPI0019068335|nr:major facilitator superfamily domain-containing protein [Cantharellus anzutake]KAF8344283.1 major facilitator superfamily domain-containing protein [Cantharellus anzutake]
MSSSKDDASGLGARSPYRRGHSTAISFDVVPSPQEIRICSEAPLSADNTHLLAPVKQEAPSRLRGGNGDHEEEDDDDSSITSEDEDGRPWYKRPSPWWILLVSGFVTCLTSMTFAAKTEIFILLVCEEYNREMALPLAALPIDNSTHGPLDHGTSTPQWQQQQQRQQQPSATGFNVFFGGDPRMPSPWYEMKIPRPSSQCQADPEVGRRVAELGTMVALTLGIFSVLTTGFWSKLSDSKGRTWVLRFGVLGSVLSDINFVAVTLHSRRIAGSYDLFLWSSILDGVVTRSAAAHAYVSDCTHPTARSRMFSLYLGIVFVGMSLGPALGGIITSRTGNLLTPFYAATAGHVAYFLIMCFLVPESLSKRQMAISATAQRRKAVEDATSSSDEIARGSSSLGTRARVTRVARASLGFLDPLIVFAPVDRGDQMGSGLRKNLDWNLSCVAGASAFVSLLAGASQFKIQYTAALFDWSPEEIGYWITALEIFRSFYLVILLPLITKFFGSRRADSRVKDTAPDYRRDHTERTPLIHSASRSVSPTPSCNNNNNDSRHATHYDVAFDLLIAKGSLIVEMISAFLTSLAPGPRTFSVATLFSSLGAGFAPVHQSLALSLMSRSGGTDAGKLFGAFAVINSLGQIAGPAVYGATYILTDFWLPQGIFWLSFLISSVAFVLLLFVRLAPAPSHTIRSIP